MTNKYLPSQFEAKWVEKWEKEKVYQTPKLTTDNRKLKTYCLSMFPYPSGAGLHVGHVRIYTGTDVLARYLRMKGYAVLHPMGWDAFGLPAENAAIAARKNPMDMVPKNIANFKRQMKMLGFSYDWDREFSTTDPEYYKWTQWLFIQFFKMGLLYKKNAPINFCPKCKTGLAEEEVLSDGTHERCGNKIEKRELPQWLFRITDYADRLLADLHGLDWPEGILEMQRNWIGKKEGINITYSVINPKSEILNPKQIQNSKFKIQNSEIIGTITCFTTRPDTNFGATFIVVAPEHKFVASLLSERLKVKSEKLKEIKKYVEQAASKTELERVVEGRKKTGVFTGFYAVNNLNGRLMPIWISDFALATVGTGAVVGVPGHDIRDFEFAKQFSLEIVRVVVGKDGDRSAITKKEQVQESAFAEASADKEGEMMNSGFLDGLPTEKAKEKIMDYLEEKGFGKRVVSYHLRDWIFSRQRYWGEPIPMIYCEDCAKKKISYWDTIKNPKSKIPSSKQILNSNIQNSKQKKNLRGLGFRDLNLFGASNLEFKISLAGWFPVPENELPVKLPYVKSYQPTETGESPLAKILEFVNTKCPNCGGSARRETDTMPNWAGSCWYFLAFAFANALNSNNQAPNSKQCQNTNDQNSKSLKSFEFRNSNLFGIWNLEFSDSIRQWLPVDCYLGGAEHAVLHLLYSRFWVKALRDLKLLDFSEPFLRLRNVGMVLAEDHRKMSKSLGNVINPDDVVTEYGADTLRIYEMFMAPFSSEIAWSTKALQGAYRFLTRIWQIYQNPAMLTNNKNEEDKKLVTKLQRTILKVSSDITNVKFNTAIAAMMEFINAWEETSTEKPPRLDKNNLPGTRKNLRGLTSFIKIKTSKVNVGLNDRTSQVNGDKRQLSVGHAKQFLQLLAPLAPFVTEQIWREVFKEQNSIHLSLWPKAEGKIVDEEIVIPVQVNGKLRATISVVSNQLSVKSVTEKVLKQEKVKKYLAGKKYKIIYVPGKILNFVTTPRITPTRWIKIYV
jgi:leucyl-tRNA synthetase